MRPYHFANIWVDLDEVVAIRELGKLVEIYLRNSPGGTTVGTYQWTREQLEKLISSWRVG